MLDRAAKAFFHLLANSTILKRAASQYGMRRGGSFARQLRHSAFPMVLLRSHRGHCRRFARPWTSSFVIIRLLSGHASAAGPIM